MPSIGHLLETKVHHLIDHLLQRKHADAAAPSTPATPAGWNQNSVFVPGTPGTVRTPGAGPAATNANFRGALPHEVPTAYVR